MDYPYVLDGLRIRFAYLKDNKGRIITVASVPASDTTVDAAFAVYSPKEKVAFTKKRGREIAIGRLAKGKSVVLPRDWVFGFVAARARHVEDLFVQEVDLEAEEASRVRQLADIIMQAGLDMIEEEGQV